MAERHQEDDESSMTTFDRRSYLKLAGSTAAVAATGLAGSAAAEPSGYDPDRVVNLGDKGLTNGDAIDPYLDEYFQNGTEVRVPEGEYRWNGGGFGGNATANAGVIGEGEVILTTNGRFYTNVRAYGGALVIKNFTVRGTVTSSRVRAETDSGGHILIENWNFPDGSETDDRARAFYVPKDHSGLVEFRNCYVSSFSDNGIYASSPGMPNGGRHGKVIMDGCVAHNNNISGLRIGSNNSVIRNCLVINDAHSPEATTGHNQRGIWVRAGGDDQLIENCDVIHTYSGASRPINFARDGFDSTGHIENVRIRNDTSSSACNAHSDFTGNDIDVTGDGNLSVPSHFTNVCQGSGCTEPDGDHQVDDRDGADGEDSSKDCAGDETEYYGTDGYQNGVELVLDCSDSGGVRYAFTAEEDVTPLYGRDCFSASSDVSTTEWEDGTVTASGDTTKSWNDGDSFWYEGDMLAWNVSEGDEEGLRVYANGVEVNPEEDLVNGDAPQPDSGDGSTDDGSTDDGSTDDGSTDDGSTDDGSNEQEMDNRIIIDGTNTAAVSSYRVSVTGRIELDESLSSTVDGGTPWDELEGEYDEGSVTSVVGKGIDGYRYSGKITELTIEGSVEITIENNDL